ncbi:DNA-binding PadR family transcriptional regulator [Pullulanibacillus pueri]|uniref:Transcription regulator PadR N-terminal domain-containing protein n=1 Tax=Pullulanibacillus pueri TaxID=1437324 RepID=A0A8J2ZVT4_9BACL|nr:PadR family transcriptional regulator [Pullulanibacillus pueri]MBM7680900.1 DNA-binding PadR family transcriptional regulator [Pullulanibacillus pueri]GGH81258.1 hypothetical protein GCM10007096_18890 [Pullulanibacillus pueri]
MEERLNKLRQAMKRTTFEQLTFTDQHMAKIKQRIHQDEKPSEAIIQAVLQLLVQQKSGFELMQQLRSRGVKTFEENEGFLYIVLHRLETRGYIHSFWQDETTKHYVLDHKGKKLLVQLEKNRNVDRESLSYLLTEVSFP